MYAPIDVDTSYATQVPTVTPLTIIVADNENILIKNTGSSGKRDHNTLPFSRFAEFFTEFSSDRILFIYQF